MKGRQELWHRLSEDLEIPGEVLPGQSLMELAGENRLLIENHQGVLEYSTCRIGVRVKFGQYLICGSGLELARMTAQQLVITGSVEQITIVRRPCL